MAPLAHGPREIERDPCCVARSSRRVPPALTELVKHNAQTENSARNKHTSQARNEGSATRTCIVHACGGPRRACDAGGARAWSDLIDGEEGGWREEGRRASHNTIAQQGLGETYLWCPCGRPRRPCHSGGARAWSDLIDWGGGEGGGERRGGENRQ